MRKKHDVLMEAGKPVNGQWNFDSENRKKLPKIINQPSIFNNDV
jgi:deoxyribodipyrimidine photolyase-related protein